MRGHERTCLLSEIPFEILQKATASQTLSRQSKQLHLPSLSSNKMNTSELFKKKKSNDQTVF